jgi:membrane protease subunit HflK
VLPNIGQVLVVQDGQMSPLPLLDLQRQSPRATGGER